MEQQQSYPLTPAERHAVTLRAETLRFLSKAAPWEWFVSLTFTRDVSDATALRALREWRSTVAKDVYQGHARIGWVYAPQGRRVHETLHAHALIAGMEHEADLDNGNAAELAASWPNGGVTVRPVQNATKAIDYMLDHTDLEAADIRSGWDLDVACDRRNRCRRTRCILAPGPWST